MRVPNSVLRFVVMPVNRTGAVGQRTVGMRLPSLLNRYAVLPSRFTASPFRWRAGGRTGPRIISRASGRVVNRAAGGSIGRYGWRGND